MYRNVQTGEVLPLKPRVLRRTRDQVRREKGPCHRLRDARLEIHGHREQTLELPERHLLARLSSNCLEEHLRGIP